MILDVASCYYWLFSLYINIKIGKNSWTGLSPPVCVCVWGGGEFAVRLADAGGVFDGVFLCCPFSHGMSWVRSWT